MFYNVLYNSSNGINMRKIKGSKKTYNISQNDCYWNMLCRLDENIVKLAIDDIQNKRGVYIFWNWDDKPIRIGKAVKVRNRLLSYYTGQQNNYVFENMQSEISFVSVVYTNSEQESTDVELDLLKENKPKYNYHNI